MFAELGDKMYLVNVCVRVGAEAHVRTSSICDFYDGHNMTRCCIIHLKMAFGPPWWFTRDNYKIFTAYSSKTIFNI